MEYGFNTIGALLGLAVSIVLIIWKVQPAYSLILGALIGGVIGGVIGGGKAGIIKASALQYDVINILEAMNMPVFVLAPLTGILMAGATASTTAGAVNMSIGERMKLIPFEACIGLTSTIVSVVIFLI